MTHRASNMRPSKRKGGGANQTEPAGLGVLAEALRGFELVSIDGELAMVLRLGRRSDEPVQQLVPTPRRYTVRQPSAEPQSVTDFLAAMTRRAAGARTRAGVLQQIYSDWCWQRGLRPQSRNALRRAILARGFRDKHSNGTSWLDLALVDLPQQGGLL